VLCVAATGCAIKPWTSYEANAPKPPSPLKPPSDAALLVVVKGSPDASSAYTVFDREGPVAQFKTEAVGWSTAVVKPGLHKYYLRTWTSDFCIRLDLNATPGKVYMLTIELEPGAAASAARVYPSGQFESPERIKMPGGPLLTYPHLKLDVEAARAELDNRRSQLEDCVEHADEVWTKAPTQPHAGGWDEIVFTIP
jgi:hypothetical protein